MKKIRLYDPDVDAVCGRFEEMLGQAARPRFRATPARFEDALNVHLKRELGFEGQQFDD